METNSRPEARIVYDPALDMDAGIPLVLDEEEESTVGVPADETMQQVVDGRLR
jgi:hypothetical protein